MNRGVYATGTGMLSAQRWMEVTTNNLANATTNGYKRDQVTFREAMMQTLAANGGSGPVIGEAATGSVADGQITVFERGLLTPTGNPLDVAIDRELGMFAVRTPSGVQFTRDGSFALNNEQQLVTQAGHLVLDADQQPITLPKGRPTFGTDGTLNVNGQPIGRVGVFTGSFSKLGSNLYSGQNAQALSASEAVVKPQHIESSNVNAIQAMVDMITAGRAFEISQKSIVSQDELTQKLIQSLQDR